MMHRYQSARRPSNGSLCLAFFPRLVDLAQVPCRTQQRPLGAHVLAVTNGPTTEAIVLLDLCEYRFDDSATLFEQLPIPVVFELTSHSLQRGSSGLQFDGAPVPIFGALVSDRTALAGLCTSVHSHDLPILVAFALERDTPSLRTDERIILYIVTETRCMVRLILVVLGASWKGGQDLTLEILRSLELLSRRVAPIGQRDRALPSSIGHSLLEHRTKLFRVICLIDDITSNDDLFLAVHHSLCIVTEPIPSLTIHAASILLRWMAMACFPRLDFPESFRNLSTEFLMTFELVGETRVPGPLTAILCGDRCLDLVQLIVQFLQQLLERLPPETTTSGTGGLYLRSIDGLKHQPYKPHTGGHTYRAFEHLPKGLLVVSKEAPQRIVIRRVVAAQPDESQILATGFLQLPNRADSFPVTKKPHSQEQSIGVRGTPFSRHLLLETQGVKVHSRDHFPDKTRGMVVGNPILQPGRKQPLLIVISLYLLQAYTIQVLFHSINLERGF